MRVLINDKSIFVGTGGKKLEKGKKNLIFIHGSGGSHLSWFLQTRYFAYEGYNVISPDFPGHGFSEGDPLNSIENMSDWLDLLIKKLNLAEVNLIGHSQGCLISLEASRSSSYKIEKIILIGGSVSIPVNPYLIETSAKDSAKASSILKSWGHSKIAHIHDHTHPGFSHLNLGKRVMAMNKDTSLNLDLLACNSYKHGYDAAKNLSKPCLIIIGKKDLNTPAKFGREMSKLIAGSKLVELENAGHFLQSEFPEKVNKEISFFLS